MNTSGSTPARIIALATMTLATLALGYLGVRDTTTPAASPSAKVGALTLNPCTYETESGALPADCGTLTVPENHDVPGSRSITLPVKRIRATGPDPAEPIFRLGGGPGQTNMTFKEAARLSDRHDIVLVGYRGIDGSFVLDCPEVTTAMRHSADLAGSGTTRRTSQAYADCARRLTEDGADLDGYSLPQRVEDLEAVRRALGYQRINLISQSIGTRTAMIYAWRHPRSIHRSVMIGVNPPGHFLWDPTITDDQLARYARLCAQDQACAARTEDLAASMEATAAHLPGRWGPLAVKSGNVRAATLIGMVNSTRFAAPLNAPSILDAWLAAAEGDPSGLWAISLLADLTIPTSFIWGESAATTMIDAAPVDRYYAAGGDQGSILGNAGADLLWAGGGLTKAWPSSPDNREYQQVRPTDVETLLISGTVDFTTPAELATRELLPALRNSHQVILAELGHTTDFWRYQPEANRRLLTTFFDHGKADTSGYTTHTVDFQVGPLSLPNIAKILVGSLTGLTLAAAALLAGMTRRVRRRGGFGPRTGTWLRVLTPVILGLGGWSLAVLAVSILWPAAYLGDPLVAVPPVGAAIGYGAYCAWTRRDRTSRQRHRGLAAAPAAALAGAWLGFAAADGLPGVMTAIVGAALAANLTLLALDMIGDRVTPLPER
ncbi:alpha/beta fold hydrolase [Herbidospora sp. NEAU-GS84]|uniref:Alpha/beta fold hydrolase n=1 Tax=Herbidospora solisilvae TaxID=2696284 RepID=A0A7C9JDL4_9ACTN|nr:alpha/beta hydrolase [Herbidospora solisilvae]NAS22383.1 alpha/beta fold hydrolase [Herbidospora solisilvae]